MKKSIIFLLLATAFLLTACEQPEGPQSLIGHWKMVADHWTADFKDDSVMYVSSTQYDTAIRYVYTATSDSLWLKDEIDTSINYSCAYYFESNNLLVIDGYDALTPQSDWVSDSINSTVRTKWIRQGFSK